MRFLIIVKATPESEAGTLPSEELLAEMATFHEALAQAGALLDGSGLKPSTQGWRLRYEGSRRTVIDGPFTESKELIAGYTLFQARDREEALAWTRRFPNPRGDAFPAEIEVRPLYDLDDFPPGEALRRLSRLDDSM